MKKKARTRTKQKPAEWRLPAHSPLAGCRRFSSLAPLTRIRVTFCVGICALFCVWSRWSYCGGCWVAVALKRVAGADFCTIIAPLLLLLLLLPPAPPRTNALEDLCSALLFSSSYPAHCLIFALTHDALSTGGYASSSRVTVGDSYAAPEEHSETEGLMLDGRTWRTHLHSRSDWSRIHLHTYTHTHTHAHRNERTRTPHVPHKAAAAGACCGVSFVYCPGTIDQRVFRCVPLTLPPALLLMYTQHMLVYVAVLADATDAACRFLLYS